MYRYVLQKLNQIQLVYLLSMYFYLLRKVMIFLFKRINYFFCIEKFLDKNRKVI